MTNKDDAMVMKTESRVAGKTEPEKGFVRPATDIYESSDAYVLMIDMPGTGKDLVSLTVDGNTLTVKGIIKPLHGEDARVVFGEVRRRGYFRMFKLGEGIDRNLIDATFELGVLTVKLQKKEEVLPREIAITEKRRRSEL
jgi:HSP20 family protein